MDSSSRGGGGRDGGGRDGGTAVPPMPANGTTKQAWARWIVGWHLAFWLLMALMVLRLAIGTDLDAGRRLGGLGVAAVLSLTYLLAVHGVGGEDAYLVTSQDPRRDGTGPGSGFVPGSGPDSGPGSGPGSGRPRGGYVYLVIAVTGTGVACALDATLSMLLFIVYPQTWMLSGTRRIGVAFTGALTLSATAGFLIRYGWSPQTLRSVGPQMLTSLLFSVLLGMWIWRVVEESGERADLIAQLEATRSELATAHHAQGVMAERERVAKEIHDTLAQGFTSIVMLAQAAAAGLPDRPELAAGQLATIEDVARENLAEARALVAALAPVDLAGRTLIEAVRRLVGRFGRETGLEVDLRIGDGMTGLSRAQEVVVLRTAQEALTNVRRHARAARVTVLLEADEQGTRVEVGDDGVGFATTAEADGTGFGLAGIRSRVSQVGGRFDVASSPGEGTRVTVLLPRGDGGAPGGVPGSSPEQGKEDHEQGKGPGAGAGPAVARAGDPPGPGTEVAP